MLKTLDIMQEEELPIAGCQNIQGAVNGDAVNNSSLRPVTFAKTSLKLFLRNVWHHLIE